MACRHVFVQKSTYDVRADRNLRMSLNRHHRESCRAGVREAESETGWCCVWCHERGDSKRQDQATIRWFIRKHLARRHPAIPLPQWLRPATKHDGSKARDGGPWLRRSHKLFPSVLWGAQELEDNMTDAILHAILGDMFKMGRASASKDEPGIYSASCVKCRKLVTSGTATRMRRTMAVHWRSCWPDRPITTKTWTWIYATERNRNA